METKPELKTIVTIGLTLITQHVMIMLIWVRWTCNFLSTCQPSDQLIVCLSCGVLEPVFPLVIQKVLKKTREASKTHQKMEKMNMQLKNRVSLQSKLILCSLQWLKSQLYNWQTVSVPGYFGHYFEIEISQKLGCSLVNRTVSICLFHTLYHVT